MVAVSVRFRCFGDKEFVGLIRRTLTFAFWPGRQRCSLLIGQLYFYSAYGNFLWIPMKYLQKFSMCKTQLGLENFFIYCNRLMIVLNGPFVFNVLVLKRYNYANIWNRSDEFCLLFRRKIFLTVFVSVKSSIVYMILAIMFYLFWPHMIFIDRVICSIGLFNFGYVVFKLFFHYLGYAVSKSHHFIFFNRTFLGLNYFRFLLYLIFLYKYWNLFNYSTFRGLLNFRNSFLFAPWSNQLQGFKSS